MRPHCICILVDDGHDCWQNNAVAARAACVWRAISFRSQRTVTRGFGVFMPILLSSVCCDAYNALACLHLTQIRPYFSLFVSCDNDIYAFKKFTGVQLRASDRTLQFRQGRSYLNQDRIWPTRSDVVIVTRTIRTCVCRSVADSQLCLQPKVGGVTRTVLQSKQSQVAR